MHFNLSFAVKMRVTSARHEYSLNSLSSVSAVAMTRWRVERIQGASELMIGDGTKKETNCLLSSKPLITLGAEVKEKKLIIPQALNPQ